ncbi:MAG: lytic transglycosylase domain-containing protein [candidate division NC10 bacterium]|nr:lytic transglycosylase domain-containing protein [candidate division NC10 bacterium]
MRKTVCLLWGLLLLALLPEMAIASNARVYRRVNASGAIRYSNIPPPTRSFASYRVKAVPAPSRLRPMIRSASDRYGVDPRLVEAIIAVESAFDPGAVSPKGAMGLMQLMPETADRYAVQNPFDPLQNISGGIRYLRDLLSRFNGNLRLALAAYNAGETAVNMYQGVPPYRETRTYVKRVLRRYGWPTALITRRASPVRVYRFPGSRGQIIYTNIPARIPLR